MWPKKYIISVFFLFVSFLRGRSFDLEGEVAGKFGRDILGDDHLILRGGGGGLALLVGTDYLFSTRARPENLFLECFNNDFSVFMCTLYIK